MGLKGRRRLARRRTSPRGTNIRQDRWSTNMRFPRRAVSQHASTCAGTHSQGQSISTQSSPLLLFLTSSRRLSVSSISSGPPPFPLSADVLEDDISASPAERHGGHQSPSFASLPGLPGDQLLSDFLAVVPPLNHSPGHAQVRKQRYS